MQSHLLLFAIAASLAPVSASHSTPLTGPTCRDSDLFSNERWLHALHDSLSHCVDADPLARIHFCGTEHSLSMFAAEVARAPAEARFTVIIPLEHCGMHGDLIAGLLTDQRIANIFATTADGATVEVSQLPSPNLELLARDAFAGPPCAKLSGALERVFGSLEGALLEQDPSGMRLKRHYEQHMGARPGPDVSQQAPDVVVAPTNVTIRNYGPYHHFQYYYPRYSTIVCRPVIIQTPNGTVEGHQCTPIVQHPLWYYSSSCARTTQRSNKRDFSLRISFYC